MQRGVFQVHVVVSRQAKDAGFLLQGDDVLQDLVLLLHDPPGADRVLLVGCPLALDFLRDVGDLEEFVDEILEDDTGLPHAAPQPMEIGLELMVTDRRIHVVERDVDQISGNDVDVSHRFIQQSLDPLKGAVDVRCIDQLHRPSHRLAGMISTQ